MSLNNLSKKNLFEMKDQNKYAQLIEAQSPEPQERKLDLCSLDNKLQNIEPVEDIFQGDNKNPENRGLVREISLCNLEMSSTSQSSSYYDYLSASVNFETSLTKAASQSTLEIGTSKLPKKFEISWMDLNFSYGTNQFTWPKRKSTPVLCDLSGHFRSNQLVAIIGPSGCGKTTLLQFLAGYNSSNRDKLKITGLRELKVAFIGQDDCLLPGLTPRETLTFASRLQNNKPNFEHSTHIDYILNELGLSECADRDVTKLSGGQVRRVTIAQELLYPTNLLILDEITSGLDASTSYSIARLLKQLVYDHSYPMSIVMSIHQPSARLFDVFDQVYVMSEGHCLYEGSCEVSQVNSRLQLFGLECPRFHNIADYLIEVASGDLTDGKSVIKQLVQYQRKQSQIYEGSRTNPSSIEEDQQGENNSMLSTCCYYDAIEKARKKRSRSFLGHLMLHFSRSMLRIRRSYILTWLQLATYIFLGLQLTTFYGHDIGILGGCPKIPISLTNLMMNPYISEDNFINSEVRRVQENINMLLVTVMIVTFAALEITVITFPLEAKSIKREWRNGWYQVSSYFLGRTFADLPFQMTFVVLFCIIIYYMTGQIGLWSWRFGSFVLIIAMNALIAQSVGFIFGAVFMNNLPAAVFTAPLCIFPSMLFSGFFSRVSQIPDVYQLATYFSHFRYSFDSLLVTLYGYGRCECDQDLLNAYHNGMKNQTNNMKDLFISVFGSVDCHSPNAEENSIEDTTQLNSDQSSILTSLTTASSLHMSSSKSPNPLGEALIEGMFAHMKQNETSENTTSNIVTSYLDRTFNRFSSRISNLLDIQSNFGSPMPQDCRDFNPYLLKEFELHNDDLISGLVMLSVFVVLSRIVCNAILMFTIANRKV